MLGKLMKYEWKATWKLLVPMDLFIVLMSVLAYSTVQLSFFDSDNDVVLLTGVIIILTYMLSMFVVMIGTVIYLIYRFYTSVYGDEGYLLHTLPVDKHHIIIAKAVMSAIWIIMNYVLIYLSVVFLFYTQEDLFGAFWDSMRYYVEIVNRSYDKVGAFSVIMTFIASFFALLAKILKVSACVSLGQLSSNHKVLASFGFYYGIYFVQRIFTLIYYVILELITKTAEYSYSGYGYFGLFRTSWGLFWTSWEFTLISSLIYCAVFYFLTWYVMDKKLNLD